ncbi:hypothetical protein [uncultured Mediterranean phage uvMED]|jgi:hypothetical protein|nr:hypothetical protein [uncultured Mediterranean phage uvMED]|tara:strand:+ start:1555 stop:1737 length:183 start_codon:yes stop_codon:yes gene_type:complete
MEKTKSTKIELVLNDKEECNYILYSLRKLPEITNNVNMDKLNALIGNLMIVRESLEKTKY